MIRTLELVNFRRHENTRLDFPADSQVVVISGDNGAGKTTILEGILFALYAENRNGRNGIAGLVRRGAEHEGMQVTLEFDLAGSLYKIVRRWEKGNHSAVLYVNDTPHTNGAGPVSEKVTELLGMDAVGFKLATIAKQKELDGLAELQPSKRRQAISRLLRLDLVSKAVQSARETQRSAQDGASALNGVTSVAQRQEELDSAIAEKTQADAAVTDSYTALGAATAEVAGVGVDENEYHNARLAAARAESELSAATASYDQAAAQLDALAIPAEPTYDGPADEDLRAEAEQVAARIAEAEAAAQVAQARAAAQRRLDEAQARLQQARSSLATWEDTAADHDVAAAEKTLTDTTTEYEQARADHPVKSGELAAASARLAATVAQLAKADGLGAECDACGQDVPESHRHDLTARLQATRTEQQAEVDALTAAVEDIMTRGRALAADQKTAAAALEQAREVERRGAALSEAVTSAERAVSSYTEDVARFGEPADAIDLEAEYRRKTHLTALQAKADAHRSALAAWRGAVDRRADLAVRVEQLKAQVDDATERMNAARIPDEVTAAWHRRTELMAAVEAERELLAACQQAQAAATAAVDAAQKLLDEAKASADRGEEYRTKAEIAGKTATLLDAMSRRMATQIRPQLEGQVSALLMMMSEGRFTSVKISDDYEVQIADRDGKFYPVSEFSGGESDLIALSIRLALAQVVSARHGAGGAGFLVLDEVFGSQDAGRRGAILEALRRLRGTYGQILLISHVGGLEDCADLVLEVGRDAEEEMARVAVA